MNWPDDFINKVICGDCLDILPQIPDGAVDIVITDPPYGIGLTRKTNNFGASPHTGRKKILDGWRDNPVPRKAFMEMFRVSESQVVFGANYYWECFYATGCYIVWDKRGTLPEVPFAPTEFAWTSFTDKMSKKYTVINHGFIRKAETPRVHPCEKPLELMVGIVGDFTKKDDLILDCFAGSGSTLVAAKQLGRRYIGIEIEPKYCKIAEDRLRQEILL